ncbi:sulfotransferase domain-containing protein [Loa loa]|uniref:Sulfotransferase domain-containing protein n=1 Tax=Loa loa TaxID=7209 RepID=A0A1I7VUL9_LOALO|nr:sulfotransferase domain-containing protein [Loa loa]EFO21278.1 sulfotransferase domain-containing protein [Loa loa]
MAPTSKHNRKLKIEGTDLPTAKHLPTSASCSLETHKNAFVFQLEGQPKQSYVDNEIWPPVFKPEFVRSAKTMIPRDSDIFVCTYPKCGTTWIQHICSQLLTDNYGPQVGQELCITSPMIERMGARFADNLDSPRLLKTHFTWYNVPKNNNAKYILAVRNPKDCLTSYFFHNRNFKIYNYEHGDFSAFFELFLTKNIAFGNYFDYLLSWLPHIKDKNVLFLKYEDMCADLPQAVMRIGEFLGGKAAKHIRDKTILSQIVANSTIKSMKKDQWRWFPENNLRQNIFIRKGGSGDWKNYFTHDQSIRLDAMYQKYLAGTTAEHWWKDEMAWGNVEDDIGIEADLSSMSTADGCSNSSSTSSRRDSLEDFREDSIESTDLNFLKTTIQKYIPWRERVSSQSSSGYNSLSSSLY